MSVISTRRWDHLASVESVSEQVAVLSFLEVYPQVYLFSCILCGQGGGAAVFHCWAISSSLLNEFSFKWSTGFSFVVLLFLLLLLWFTVHIGVFKTSLQNSLSLFVICVFTVLCIEPQSVKCGLGLPPWGVLVYAVLEQYWSFVTDQTHVKSPLGKELW